MDGQQLHESETGRRFCFLSSLVWLDLLQFWEEALWYYSLFLFLLTSIYSQQRIDHLDFSLLLLLAYAHAVPRMLLHNHATALGLTAAVAPSAGKQERKKLIIDP